MAELTGERFSVDRHADDGGALRDTDVPVSEKAIKMLGISPGKFLADYEYLFSKHPDQFISQEEVKQVAEWVLADPDDVLSGSGAKNRVLDRWEDAEHKNRVVIRVVKQGRRYHLRSVHRMGPKYEKRGYQSDSSSAEAASYEARSKGNPSSSHNDTPQSGESQGVKFSVEQLGFDLTASGPVESSGRRDLFGSAKSAIRQESLFGKTAGKTESAPGADLFSENQRRAPLAKKKIEDFGEVIHGARKHYAEEYLSRAKQGELLDVEAEPLSKSWPEPDYGSCWPAERIRKWLRLYMRPVMRCLPSRAPAGSCGGMFRRLNFCAGCQTDCCAGKLNVMQSVRC